MKARGAGAHGYCVGHRVVGGEGCFKGGEFGAEAEVRSAKNGADGVDFCLSDVGGTERDGDLIEVRGFPGLRIETWCTQLFVEIRLRTHWTPRFDLEWVWVA
jgi:hypothetical protein